MILAKTLLRWLLSLGMIFAGVMHFVSTNAFAGIVPDWLPAHRLLVQISGVCEIALGAGLIPPKTRHSSAWGLIALYVAVFPANINMAVNPDFAKNLHVSPIVLWLRLPLQLLLIAWAAWYTRLDSKSIN